MTKIEQIEKVIREANQEYEILDRLLLLGKIIREERNECARKIAWESMAILANFGE